MNNHLSNREDSPSSIDKRFYQERSKKNIDLWLEMQQDILEQNASLE